MPAVCPVAVSKLNLFGGGGEAVTYEDLIFFSAAFWFSQTRIEVLPSFSKVAHWGKGREQLPVPVMKFSLRFIASFLMKLRCILFPPELLDDVCVYSLSAWNTPVFCSLLFWSQCIKTVRLVILPAQPEISHLSFGTLEVLLQWQCLCTARAGQQMREVSFFHAPLCLQP